MRAPLLIVLGLCLGCPPARPGFDAGTPAERCEVDLEASGLFSRVGTGARASLVDGGVVLENRAVRFAVATDGRVVGPLRLAGGVTGATLAGAAGSVLDGTALVIGFGRGGSADQVELVRDGTSGGYAAVAIRGEDRLIDRLDVSAALVDGLGLSGLATPVEPPLGLGVTQYLVLSPGEERLRMLAVLCNRGKAEVVTTVGDLLVSRGTVFNPASCVPGVVGQPCQLASAGLVGLVGDEQAVGYRSFDLSDPRRVGVSAIVAAPGLVGVVASARGGAQVLGWTDPSASERPGALGILPGQTRTVLRELFVGADMARVVAAALAADGLPSARVNVSVPDAGRGVHVALREAATQRLAALARTGDGGLARLDVLPGDFLVAAWDEGRAPSGFRALTVAGVGSSDTTIPLPPVRTLTVSAADPSGASLSARAVVRCVGACPAPPRSVRPFRVLEDLPDGIQAVGFIDENGSTDIPLPPGQYEVLVTRGPGWSAWPQGFPERGVPVDLREADRAVAATLEPILDRAGWVAVDLHTHADGSLDSAVPVSARRLAGRAAGLDAVVITEHDVVAPGDGLVGLEVSTFDEGHLGVFPRSPGVSSLDWSDGTGPVDPTALLARIRQAFPGALVQLNHPRRALTGALTQLGVDTRTGRAWPPARRRGVRDGGAPYPLEALDMLEVLTGGQVDFAVVNDWMTFLSRGIRLTGTGGSDAHRAQEETTGSGFTWVRSSAEPSVLAAALEAGAAVISNGPLLLVEAAVDGGTPASPGQTLSVAPGAELVVSVDVQAPAWMELDSIELYTHAAGRAADAGVANTAWPEERILARRLLDCRALPTEQVGSARRVRVRASFATSATSDTWLVAAARASSACRSLSPMSWTAVRCDAGTCAASEDRPFAMSNPIYIDADGSGAYDTPPLR